MTRSTQMRSGMPAGGQPIYMQGAQPVSAFAEAPGAAQKLGMLSFLLFMYLSFGRPTDYFLSFLHLPFLFSIGALVLCVITRGAERALQTRIAVFMLGFTFWMAACIPFS